MNCTQARAEAIEQIRSGSTGFSPHFETCAECSRFLQAQLALQSAFAAASREVPAPPDLEGRLLAAFVPRPATRRIGWWMPATAALAAALVIGFVAVRRTSPHAAAEPFVEIPYIAPLAPYERTSIVRMDVAVSALIAAGFEMQAVDTGATVPADVLFGQDGRAHAIRLVSNSVPNFTAGE
jgi:hypothetical protein